MIARRGRVATLAVLLAALEWAQIGAVAGAWTIRQYISELDALRSRVAAADRPTSGVASLLATLPAVWHVNGSEREFDIPTGSVRRDLMAWASGHDDAARARLLDTLQSLRVDAAAFDARRPDRAAERARLSSILAAHEFRNIHGPTWTEQLWQRVLAFIVRVLQIGIGSSAIPTIGDVVVFAVIGAALILLGWVTYRYFRRRAAAERLAAAEVPSLARAPSLSLADARTAAASGDWRRAIHLAYWCGISFLESKGAWRPDRARTPREYLRLLPPASVDREALEALTQRCELVWYGTAPADSDAFANAMEDLKKIGCVVA